MQGPRRVCQHDSGRVQTIGQGGTEMKRPPGIILTCGLLVLLALSLLSFEDGAGAGGAGAGRFALLSLARLLLAFVSAVAAVALWQRWPRALRVYWCWGTAYL